MELPIIIAVIVGVIYTIAYILVCIIREWWKFKKQDKGVYKQVNEAERPAIIKPKRFYRGKVELWASKQFDYQKIEKMSNKQTEVTNETNTSKGS